MRQRAQTIWKILFTLSTVVTLWTGVMLVKELYGYLFYAHPVRPCNLKWQVIEKETSKFLIAAKFDFSLGGKKGSSEYVFSHRTFPNKYIAEEMIHVWDEVSWTAWVNPRFLKFAPLERNYPLKNTINFFLSLGICIYFYWLRSILGEETIEERRSNNS